MSSGVSTDVVTDSYVVGRTKQGVELRAPLLKLAPYKAVFEIFQLPEDLRVSQTLDRFKIMVADRPIYEGRAVTSSLIELGAGVVCEATLEDSWVDRAFHANAYREAGGRAVFNQFVEQWQSTYRIHPEFKAVVADIQTFLTDMRMWLDQVDLGHHAKSSGKRDETMEIASDLAEHTEPTITTLFENFERTLSGIAAENQSVYQNFGKRQLHRLLLCSPFLHRTYSKPLGYAGDYEMVNMICRNPFEGDSLYAKLVNHWFIQQPPAEAHRNRIQFLTDRLAEVALETRRLNRPVRIMSIGCGPAQEVQRFIAENGLSDHAHIVLVDFNEETATYTLNLLNGLTRRYNRRTQIEMVRKSVHQILKEGGRGKARTTGEQFDFVYCAGLFDYLTNQTCHRLTNILYEQVLPGGMFVSTNVDIFNPRRLTMDYLMDWHLIYRNGRELAALRPDGINQENELISADATGVNIYYTLRKPARE